MRAKRGYREWKAGYRWFGKLGIEIHIGKWLHRYFEKRTSRRWKLTKES
jgi:hypothetical protein